MGDPINHPAHYELDGYECIDVMLATQGREAVMAFCKCNAFKYLWRHRFKGGDEDLEKARRYLGMYMDLKEAQ